MGYGLLSSYVHAKLSMTPLFLLPSFHNYLTSPTLALYSLPTSEQLAAPCHSSLLHHCTQIPPTLWKILPVSWMNCLCFSRAIRNDWEERKKKKSLKKASGIFPLILNEFPLNLSIFHFQTPTHSLWAVSAMEDLCKHRLNLAQPIYSFFHCQAPLILIQSH